jgi:hypothetical protein
MKTTLSSINEFLQNQLGIKAPIGELTDMQAERFRQWAASVPGTDVFTGPKAIVFDGQSSKTSMTNLTEYILYEKDTKAPSGYQPISKDIKTGIEIEFTPLLSDDNKQIRLSINFEKSDAFEIAKTTHKSGNEVQFPGINRKKISTQIVIPTGKYSLIIPSGIKEISHPDGNVKSAESQEHTILLIKADVQGKPDSHKAVL